MKKIIGLINGGGTGPEVIEATKKVIKKIEKISGEQFHLINFENEKYKKEVDIEKWDKKLYDAMVNFYEMIQKKDGIILRGSMPAPILYKLRAEKGIDTKVVPLNPYPKYSISQNFDVLLIRENSQGVYHCDNIQKKSDFIKGEFHYDKQSLNHLARISFEQANKRRKKLALVLKTSVLGEIGNLWKDIFQEKSKEYPSVEYSIRPSGAGFSDMYLFPQWYDVVVTDDQGGDIIADVVPTMLYRTRNLVPALNIGRDGFCIYQTDHGTTKNIAKQNKMNPIGMITALSMALEYSFKMTKMSKRIKKAVDKTLSQGFRTEDMYQKQKGQKLVGTKEITNKIIQNL